MKNKQFSVLNNGGGHKKNHLCKLHKQIIAMISSLTMLIGMIPSGSIAYATEPDDVTLTISNKTVTFTAENCESGCNGHIITQDVQNEQLQRATIIVESGTHNVTFSGLNLTNANVGVMPGAKMNLTLADTNTIQGNDSGIYVPEGATLVIGGNGSLNVSASSSAGIGGAYVNPSDPSGFELGNRNCGTVEINGGNISATGGSCSAGIGGAAGTTPPGNGGTVTINGGTVTATGGGNDREGGAGIGGGTDNGKSGCGGTLTINGGRVTLTSGHSSAYGFGRGSGSNSNAGTLTLADASYLDENTTLDPKGTYFITADPTEDMIAVPDGLVYTGNLLDVSGIKIDDSKNGTAEYFGQTFNVNASADGWERSFSPAEVKEAGNYTVTFTKSDKSISKTFTVAECSHTGLVYAQLADGKHSGTCTLCGTEVSEEHKWVDGVCSVCQAKAVVKVEIGSDTAYYGTIEEAWTAVQGKTATVTLLSDVISKKLTIDDVNSNITFDGGIYTLTSTSDTAFYVNKGNLTIAGGTIQVTSDNNAYVVYVINGAANITGGDIQATSTSTVNVAYGVYSAGTVSITGGNIQATGGNTGFGVYSAGTVNITGGNIQATDVNISAGVYVLDGTANITDGNIQATGYKTNGVNVEKGEVSITGGDIQATGFGAYGVNVSGGTVNITGGTFTGREQAIRSYNNTINELLGKGYAYYQTDGKPVTSGLDSNELPKGTYTVKKCDHSKAVCTNNENGTHDISCPACGYMETADCTYGEYQHDDTNHWQICEVCDGTKTEEHTITAVDEKEPTCTNDGNIAYWYCSGCEKYFTDETCKNEVSKENTIIPASHTLTKTEGKSPTCTEDGTPEYWYCSVCEKYFSDEKCENEITKEYIENAIITATGHNITHITAKSATCTSTGNIEYWYCGNCKKYFSDENGENEIAYSSIVISSRGHSYSSYRSNNDATCTKDGTKYCSCYYCGRRITATDLGSAKGHSFTEYVSDGNATCIKDGTKTAECDNCNETDTITEKATGHNLTHTDRKEPTAANKGNIEYWYCGNCKKYFSDEACKTEIKLSDTEIPMVTTVTTKSTTTTTTTTTAKTTTATTKATTATTKATTVTTKATTATTKATTVTTNATTATTKATTATTKATTVTTKATTATTKATTATTKATTATTKSTTVTTVTTITTTPVTTTTKPENSDKIISVSHMVLIQQFILGSKKLTAEQWKQADMNSDGKVNVFDVIILKRKLLHI